LFSTHQTKWGGLHTNLGKGGKERIGKKICGGNVSEKGGVKNIGKKGKILGQNLGWA